MNLKDLVPPLELCKKIPAGEFEDSAFVYVLCSNKKDFQLHRRTCSIEAYHKFTYPAPTLQEIIAKLPRTVKTDFIGDEFHIYNDVKNGYGVTSKTPVIAALTLWLRLKGVK